MQPIAKVRQPRIRRGPLGGIISAVYLGKMLGMSKRYAADLVKDWYVDHDKDSPVDLALLIQTEMNRWHKPDEWTTAEREVVRLRKAIERYLSTEERARKPVPEISEMIALVRNAVRK